MVSIALIDGGVNFVSAHDCARMSDPAALAVKERVTLIPDPALMDSKAPRSGKVEVVMKDGRTLEHFTPYACGTKQNPMSTADVSAKVRDLMAPVLGASRTEAVIRRVNALESIGARAAAAARRRAPRDGEGHAAAH